MQLVISRCILLNLLIKLAGFTTEARHIRSEPFQLRLSRNWLLEKHFNPLVALFLVVELSPNNIIAYFAVLPHLVPEIVQHLLWTQVLTRQLLGIHQALSD